MADNQDILSPEDLLALHQTYIQLHAAGDPRADKLRSYLVESGKQALANPSANQTQFEKNNAPAPAAYGFTPGNIVKNVGRGLSELGQGVVQGLDDVGGAILPQRLGGDPITKTKLVEHIVQPMQAEAAKARDLQAQGQPYVGHAIASGIPLIGPYAANLGDQAATGDIGGMVARAGTQYAAPYAATKAIPLALKAGGKAVLLGKTPEAAYESALKPSVLMPQFERSQIVKTALENDIPVSKSGLNKIGDALDNYNSQIYDVIAKDPNRPIVPGNAAITEVRNRFQNQVAPASDLKAIDRVNQEFIDSNPVSIPAGNAQAMKQGTYQILKAKYGELGSASTEAQKALARDLKDEIAVQFPEISRLNAAESELLNLQPVLERAVNRIGNHQVIGIGTPVAGAAGKAITGSSGAGAAVGVLKAVLDNPMVKSKLAIAVSRANRIPLNAAVARVQSYSKSLGSYAAAQGSVSNEGTASGQPTQQP